MVAGGSINSVCAGEEATTRAENVQGKKSHQKSYQRVLECWKWVAFLLFDGIHHRTPLLRFSCLQSATILKSPQRSGRLIST